MQTTKRKSAGKCICLLYTSAGVEKTLEDFRDCYAVGGIDLSQTTDLTAASVAVSYTHLDVYKRQFFSQPDHPVRHVLPGYGKAISKEFLFKAIKRDRVYVFSIHEMCIRDRK